MPALPEETEPPAAKKAELALHAARDGSAVALVRDYGRYGVVADTISGEVVTTLDRGDYRVDLTRFPCAFTEHAGKSVLLAGTDWNRVDAYALPSGTLLTDRGPTRYAKGEPRPEHYLDFFYGALHVSPDGFRVVDDGWVWHPLGVPLLWDVRSWLDGDTWQAEAGEALLQRGYLWDTPMCWVGEEHVAIWGVGDDDTAVLPGVVVVPIAGDAAPVRFAGVPRQQFWSNGRHLFAASEIGLTVWDPFAGERLAELVGLNPLSYNPWTDEFLINNGYDTLDRIRLLID